MIYLLQIFSLYYLDFFATVLSTFLNMASKLDGLFYDQRVYIKYRTLLGNVPKDIHSDPVSIHMDNAHLSSRVYEWVKQFRGGRDSYGP